jgi:hypothetical protein
MLLTHAFLHLQYDHVKYARKWKYWFRYGIIILTVN